MTELLDGAKALLFVDDEEKARKYFRMAFNNDFPVLLAASVDEALSILAQRGDEIALVVTDQRMPGRLGVELLREVRQSHPQIVRILTTAYSDLDSAIDGVNRGEIYRYVTKPWELDDLRAELKRAMELYQLRAERNALLAEKLSVSGRMAELAQAQLLLALSAAIPELDDDGRGVVGLVSDWQARGLSLSKQPADAVDDSCAAVALAEALPCHFSALVLAPGDKAVGMKEVTGALVVGTATDAVLFGGRALNVTATAAAFEQLALSLGASESQPATIAPLEDGGVSLGLASNGLADATRSQSLESAFVGHLLCSHLGLVARFDESAQALRLGLDEEPREADRRLWADRLLACFEAF